MSRRVTGGSLACSIGAVLAACSTALAAAPHTVLPGETLWSISYANNLTTRTVAVYNGLPENGTLRVGATVYVPTVKEGAAALAAGKPTATPRAGAAAVTSSRTIASAPGMGHIPSPYGELHLAAAAANAWNAMRAEALRAYGVDIYPGGPLSAYRTYEQQARLYKAFLAGRGPLANPPGTSSHERGTAVDLATPAMRRVIDQIGWKYGWSKVHGPGEWWHVDYVGR
jgi:murein DD-endopeptidase MepM/ murein hydrolase activator NlpD